MGQTNLALTRGQIITEGLGRAGRSDLSANARLWLNLFLESQYMNQDFRWLQRDVEAKLMVEGDSLPTDYSRMGVITCGPNRLPMRVVEFDEYEYLRTQSQSPYSSGTPQWVYIDAALNVIHFLPVPPAAGPNQLTYNYFYFFFPPLPDPTNPALDSQIPVWGLSNDILIEAVYMRALQWNDDLRFKEEKDQTMALLNLSKMNSRDLRAGSPKFKLGKSHKKRF